MVRVRVMIMVTVMVRVVVRVTYVVGFRVTGMSMVRITV